MERIKMIVEIPTGSSNKYEFNPITKEWELDRVLYGSMFYPCEYGFIPETIDYDGDNLDSICLVSYPTFPGCIISTKVIGVLKMIDQGDYDYKLITVPINDPRFEYINNLKDLGNGKLNEISNFFLRYKELEKKEVVIEGYGDKLEALTIIKECCEMFNDCKKLNLQTNKEKIISFLKNKKK
jgi:inorganic pyrophosphatase